jgi:macrolide transport system ATP-binding/permease protein
MNAHRLRTFLTMLGIIIGIASVVSVVALGNGSQQQILQNISALGTNTIDVYPGRGFGDMRSARVQTLKASDADALAKQSYVDSATPACRPRSPRVTATSPPPPRSAALASSSSGSRA